MLLPDLKVIQVSLSSKEKESADIILLMLQKKMEQSSMSENDIDIVAHFPQHVLLYICQQDKNIEHFCRTNVSFQNKLQIKLNAVHRQSIAIKTMDNKRHYDVLDFYLAAYYLSLYDQLSRTDRNMCQLKKLYLNYSSILGANEALIMRCRQQEQHIKNHPEKADEFLKSLSLDLEQLINIYWAYGYVQSGCILHAISADLAPIENEKNRVKTLLEQAVKYFICAELLHKQDPSHKIIINMTGNKGILSLFESHGHSPFTSCGGR